MIDGLIKDDFLCCFRENDKKRNYGILIKIRDSLKDGRVRRIVEGCVMFMEMKLQVFNVFKDGKIEALY